MRFDGKHIAVLSCCLFLLWGKGGAIIQTSAGGGGAPGYRTFKNYGPQVSQTINQVSFTQKGYIQFLKYVTEVPTLTEYTFCIWLRSSNLTYAHPLLSYSRNEEERLVRVWISAFGTELNLAILERPVFKIAMQFVENHWYHICQSWSSHKAHWNLYMNGKLKSSGFEPKLRGVRIQGGGDIVVGQEYTDFDKGLDDGVEGDVFGFNLVRSATSAPPKFGFPLRRHYDVSEGAQSPLIPLRPLQPLPAVYADDVPQVLAYFPSEPYRKSRGIADLGSDLFNSVFGYFRPPPPLYVVPVAGRRGVQVQAFAARNSLNSVDSDYVAQKTVGLKLVELTYNCALGKGAPLSGRDVVVSWTKTPVRVFGGAILTTVPPFCT